jgi:WD repeat and FYVE domain-containing protein 3
MASRLQYHMINLIKNLLRFERNQQIMSNARFIDDLLFTCKYVLNDENHFLNSSIQHIFERLATQSITSKSLREYLRLGTIFDTNSSFVLQSNGTITSTSSKKSRTEANSLDNNCAGGALIPLNRVKCLISMTTLRDNKFFIGTSFVEFNMFVEGFGCLFLPSIAPQLTNAPSIVAMGMVSVGNDISVNGGVGSGERIFPPQSGLSASTWIYIDKFGPASQQQQQLNQDESSLENSVSIKHLHPIRILTLIKHSKIRDTLTSCLTVYISPKSKSLYVCTEETLLTQQKQDQQTSKLDAKTSDYVAKFNCAELFEEGRWLHIALVWSRAVLKNSSVTLYVNSNLIASQKLHYINSSISANSTPSSMSIHAVVGTLPMFRLQSPVVWRQASCYLFEEIISPQAVQSIFRLGPNYLGSFQSPPNTTNDLNESLTLNTSLMTEDKIIFGLHAQNIFEMTLAKFRRVYSKNDSKTIGKQLNIPTHESVTPLRILSNTAVQLNGPARSVGAVIIGYLGVRTFQPMPVAKTIEHIGGVSFLLSLIAMANDIEFMYASVKALVCIVKSNSEIAKEMDR